MFACVSLVPNQIVAKLEYYINTLRLFVSVALQFHPSLSLTTIILSFLSDPGHPPLVPVLDTD